jgi:hypothetical protein
MRQNFDIRVGAFRSVVGFFGFNHDRKLALRALAVSASGNDVHSVFAGLALMTYYGVVLLMSGYQADEKYILEQYRSIVDKCVHAPPGLLRSMSTFLLKVNQTCRLENKYPTGTLWILNRVRLPPLDCHNLISELD